MPNKNKVIYLTFDDGPIPEVTDFVLKTLKEFEAKATFFCIGYNVDKNREIFDKLLSNGHSIGNHTYNHMKGWDSDNEEYIANFQKCNEALPKTNLFRAPYGKIKRKQAKFISNTHKIIMWDVVSGDFLQNISKEKCLEKSIKYSEPGTIIVFHDSLKAFTNLEYTLPKYLAHFKELGYKFEALKL